MARAGILKCSNTTQDVACSSFGCLNDVNHNKRFVVGIAPVKNCLEAFCGENVEKFEENRTMFMTPGWIRAWPSIMKSMGCRFPRAKTISHNKSVETNRRPACPFNAGRQFETVSCAPPFLSTAVAHLGRVCRA